MMTKQSPNSKKTFWPTPSYIICLLVVFFCSYCCDGFHWMTHTSFKARSIFRHSCIWRYCLYHHLPPQPRQAKEPILIVFTLHDLYSITTNDLFYWYFPEACSCHLGHIVLVLWMYSWRNKIKPMAGKKRILIFFVQCHSTFLILAMASPIE